MSACKFLAAQYDNNSAMSLSGRVNQTLARQEGFSQDQTSSLKIDGTPASKPQTSQVDSFYKQLALQTYANAGNKVYTVA